MPASPKPLHALAVLLCTSCAFESADAPTHPPDAVVATSTPTPLETPRTTPGEPCEAPLVVEVNGQVIVLPAPCDPRQPSPVDPAPDHVPPEIVREAIESR
jgi:hypothetical protein